MNSNYKLPNKPKQGEPCNHCGQCCAQEICLIGKCLLPINIMPPCPFLFQLENTETKEIKFLCHLVTMEKVFTKIKKNSISEGLGIKKGCCSEN